jgi:hypothetical protein
VFNDDFPASLCEARGRAPDVPVRQAHQR